VSGDLQAKNVYRHQPAKMAAMEAHYRTGPADLALFGVPDDDAGRVRYELSLPGVLSFLLHEDPDAPVLGLDRFRPEDRPPVGLTFAAYHVMVAVGIFFIGVTLLAGFLLWRRQLYQARWLLWVYVFAVLAAVAGNQMGWMAAEVGRQPWIVQAPVVREGDGEPILDEDGYVQYQRVRVAAEDGTPIEVPAGLRTPDGVSESVTAPQVLASILLFGVIYLLLGALWVFVLNHKIQQGPPPMESRPGGVLGAAAARVAHDESLTEAKQG
jgi:cytochrome d ubiquinol oxidase subunit I